MSVRSWRVEQARARFAEGLRRIERRVVERDRFARPGIIDASESVNA